MVRVYPAMRATDIQLNITPLVIEMSRLKIGPGEALLLRCPPENVEQLIKAVKNVPHDYGFKVMVASNEVDFTVIEHDGPV